jgi:antitoxin component of RelBE/YafQ-DinJ toxin-antitoxin module
MKNEYLQIRISEEEKEALSEIARHEDVPVSQFVRQTLKEKINAWKETHVEPVVRPDVATAEIGG